MSLTTCGLLDKFETMSQTTKAMPRSRAPSRNLAQGLRVLEWLSRWPGGTGVREAAAALNITHSSAHRFLETMRAAGWVQQSSQTRKYELGPAAIRVGLAVLERMDLREVTRLPLRELADRTGETAYLGILLGNRVVYIDIVTGDHPIVVNRRVGWKTWAHGTAVGKVLLADLPPEQLEHLLGRRRLPRVGPRGLRSIAELGRELDTVRATGFAVNDEESEAGVLGLAVPIRDSGGRVVAGLGIGGPRDRMRRQRAVLLAWLQRCGRKISAALGYSSRGHPETTELLQARAQGG